MFLYSAIVLLDSLVVAKLVDRGWDVVLGYSAVSAVSQCRTTNLPAVVSGKSSVALGKYETSRPADLQICRTRRSTSDLASCRLTAWVSSNTILLREGSVLKL